MKKIICGVSALLFGIVALNAETIDNKSTQDAVNDGKVLRYNKRAFIRIYDENGVDVTDEKISKEDFDKMQVMLDDSHKDMELIDRGNGEIEIRKKGSPNRNSK